ncbi:unnamed protein product [Rotaria sp. Silwood2]|nr:unnamed protein product [Rotaria sp. Silwood2]CAF3931812.1 unnamed protein product [Rotaria sp. Silwood2]
MALFGLIQKEFETNKLLVDIFFNTVKTTGTEFMNAFRAFSLIYLPNAKDFDQSIRLFVSTVLEQCCDAEEYFDLILTPLVFNVEMKFQSDLFDVEHVYGSLECDETKQGECIKINTLFPSRTDDEQQTRGGIVLLKLKTKESITHTFSTTTHFSNS